jgi:hypothetical protein
MKILNPYILILVLTAVSVAACKDDAPTPPEPVNYSYIEEFDSLSVAFAKDWTTINRSEPLGVQTWTAGGTVSGSGKGSSVVFYGAAVSNYSGYDCILSSYQCGGAVGTLSNWLISPATKMKNGDQITFFTRSAANSENRADRLQVLLNNVGDSKNIGAGATGVGDFSVVLEDINPTLVYTTTTGFPKNWTKYTITLTGLPAGLQTRRFAFRYYVPGGGTASGSKGFGVGIDQVQFISK